MVRYFLTCLCMTFLCVGGLRTEDAKTVCVNMIIKNESDVICRCLASVKPLIDYWVIVDTGSTDGTQQIVRDFMKDIPGELHERPWVDFAHNRNQALELAKGKADYVLFIDADEVFRLSDDFAYPKLDKDFYYIPTSYSGLKYNRVQLINNHLNWKWMGVLHEVVVCNEARNYATLQGITDIVNTDGARSKDPRKFHKDAQVLEAALEKEPDSRRYQFYLAQSYRDAGELELALKNYNKRIAMGGWEQEIFWSMLQVALLEEALEKPQEVVIASYQKAYDYDKSRAEPLYRIANLHRRAGNYKEGYQVAHLALFMPVPEGSLFIDAWIYDYALLMEYSICAYWLEKYEEAEVASHWLLAKPTLPNNFREAVQGNLIWVNKKLAERKLAA